MLAVNEMIEHLNRILWCKEIGKRRKYQIYETNTKSDMCESEIWRLTEDIKQRAEAIEIDTI